MNGTHAANRLTRGQGTVRRWPGRIIASKEAPVGVEPTPNRFAGGCRAVWLQRRIGRSARGVRATVSCHLKVVVAIYTVKTGQTSSSNS